MGEVKVKGSKASIWTVKTLTVICLNNIVKELHLLSVTYTICRVVKALIVSAC
jgi:hypothetical protein